MYNFINTKKECAIIVTEQDLTTVLAVLDEHICRSKIQVMTHANSDNPTNRVWRVAFHATAYDWKNIYAECREGCKQKLLVPLKDSFGNITYHEL